MYTDGSCLKNPGGPGGYGVVISDKEKRTELSGGYKSTTNNRMELLACIKGLETFEDKQAIVLYSDSLYVINGIKKGWVRRWRANGWMRNKTGRAINADLWERLLALSEYHVINFQWVKGHNNNKENERCDYIAQMAASGYDLLEDYGLAAGPGNRPPQSPTTILTQHSFIASLQP
ncbi:MAG: ribonuclease HI [wastewater metagenome]|nr:ribonuclease HI [Candidatus Loosdrechtia aerotolerans]